MALDGSQRPIGSRVVKPTELRVEVAEVVVVEAGLGVVFATVPEVGVADGGFCLQRAGRVVRSPSSSPYALSGFLCSAWINL